MNRFLLTVVLLFFGSTMCLADVVQDEFVNEWFKDKEINQIEPVREYNYESLKRTKIILSPTETVSTPNNIYEGQVIGLQVKRNVKVGQVSLKRGMKGEAIVELYTTNGMSGIPAEIVVDRLKIEGVDNSRLRYYCVKKGQDRTLWILPLKWALTFIPFAGTLTNLIKGGQATLSPIDNIVVYYYE